MRNIVRRTTLVLALATRFTWCVCLSAGEPAAGLTAPEGFEVSLFADDDLAHDIFSLTINARGEVVVSGPGYVRALLDEDGDGCADTYRTFANSPATGAQGLYFDGNDLLCTGDGGLLRYRDHDGDGTADGAPEKILTLKTGGEHFAHAIERGPDGWWYVLLGNLTGIDRDDVTLSSSPVREPRAGVLMRLAPDFSGAEVVADGYRNPYDFAFHANGEAFAFDSDGERDVSLPWYRPTRVFQILPGTHAGWITPNWKHPDYFAKMPPVVADCGRGSPTGVVVYRHKQFPDQYHNALFILDWTFGRVFAIDLAFVGTAMRGQAETFLTATGQFGFAPTDIAVTPNGDLMISVGGRGTRGGVYRVHYTGTTRQRGCDERSPQTEDALTKCLTAPQPLASWSRASWKAIAVALGKARLVTAALDARRPIAQRVRAIEIVTELFRGFSTASLADLIADSSATIRARTAWALSRQPLDQTELDLIDRLLGDSDPRVVRNALEVVLRNTSHPNIATLFPQLLRQLDARDRHVWQAAWLTLARLTPEQQRYFAKDIANQPPRVRVGYVLAITRCKPTLNPPAFDLAWHVFLTAIDPQLRLDALRATQRALGDLFGRDDLPGVYDGYAGRGDLATAIDIDFSALASAFPSGNHDVDIELARLIAMLAPADVALAEKLGERLTDDSHPIDDVHYLIALSRLDVPFSNSLRQRIAQTLVGLEEKLRERNLQQDRNWDLRVEEMYRQLIQHDSELAAAVVEHSKFGRPGHVVLARVLSGEPQSRAATRIAQYLEDHTDAAWTNDVVFLLGRSSQPEHEELVRQQFDDFALRGAVIRALSRHPREKDREKYLVGLRSPDFAVLQAAVGALRKLSPTQSAEEQFALLNAFRRLGADTAERSVRDRVVQLLQRNMDQNFGYQFERKTNSPQPQVLARWTEYLKRRFPDMAQEQLHSEEQQRLQLQARLADVDWASGQPERGQKLFKTQSCYSCHNVRTAVGPDLSGIGTRFARNDLFEAIVNPNKDVSPRYNITLIETTRGKVLSGLVIYESVDGVTLLDSTNQTIRIEADEIDVRQELPSSLMPAGLLDGLTAQDLADLYAYLRTL